MFILLHGSDDFVAHEELAQIKAEGDFLNFPDGVDTFSGLESSLDEIRSACDTLPFFTERRLVVLESLPRKKRGRKEAGDGASDGSAFVEGLAQHVVPQMPATTILVVVVDELLDASHPLVKAARSHGEVRVCVAPRGSQLEAWLIRRARTAGSDLTPAAAHLLATSGSESLWALAGEVEKLSTYVGRGGKVGPEEVRALAPASHRSRVFDLTDALARRDSGRALALLHELLESGESPFGIVALTAAQTRSLLQIKTLSERGKRRAAEIAQIAGIAPYVVEKSLPLARQFSLPELEATHRRLLDIDAALKRSKMTPDMALDLLVFEFGSKGVE